jgi:hypothetical protein
MSVDFLAGPDFANLVHESWTPTGAPQGGLGFNLACPDPPAYADGISTDGTSTDGMSFFARHRRSTGNAISSPLPE